MHRLRSSVALLLLLALAQVPAHAVSALQSDLRRMIRQRLEGKLLLLHSPSNLDLIQFNAEGRPLRPFKGEPWTTCGLIQAMKVQIHGYQIAIDGQRVIAAVDPQASAAKLVPVLSERLVHVSVDVPRNIQKSEDLNEFLSRVFSTEDVTQKLANAWRAEVDLSRDLTDPTIELADGLIATLEGGRPVYSWERGTVTKPKALYKPGPVYPVNARLKHVSGNIRVRLIVNERGFPEILEVIQHLGEGLDANALTAVSQWHFERPLHNGKAAATMLVVELKFRIRGKG
jgi:TonB family protein